MRALKVSPGTEHVRQPELWVLLLMLAGIMHAHSALHENFSILVQKEMCLYRMELCTSLQTQSVCVCVQQLLSDLLVNKQSM